MPIRKVPGGYRYGKVGKVYPTKKKAAKQAAAIIISQKKAGKRVR